MFNKIHFFTASTLIGLGLAAQPVFAANQTCQTAQDLTAQAWPTSVSGQLDSTTTPDIDFYKFKGTPGALVRINLDAETNSTLDPRIEAFNSNCELIGGNDDFLYPNTLNSEWLLQVPDDGIIVVAATFTTVLVSAGANSGGYKLTLTPTDKIGSVNAVVQDIISHQSLAGAFADLYYCNTIGCVLSNTGITDNDGKISWTKSYFDIPLAVGSYKVVAGASQYELGESPVTQVGKNQDKTLNVELKSYPARLSTTPCNNIASTGGKCRFEVTITNGQAGKLIAPVWSIVEGYSINQLGQRTQFPLSTQIITLSKNGSSKKLAFQFNVPARVQDGALICANTYVGSFANALKDLGFNLKGTNSPGFCIYKGVGQATFSLVSKAQATKLQQQSLPLSGRFR
jgi:hypothetical protein